jgi:hypothetical protein
MLITKNDLYIILQMNFHYAERILSLKDQYRLEILILAYNYRRAQ